MKRSVLFTSAYFKGYAGSEIAVLEQASALLSEGWDVSIFCLAAGEPLMHYVSSEIRVYTVENGSQMPRHFDLIISRQYPLLDWLLFAEGIQASKIYYESVGYQVAWDAPPSYYRNLTLTGVVSELTRTKLADYGYDTSNSYLYPNSAPASFFEENVNLTGSISKIAIVSNHMPSEIEDFAIKAAQYDCTVDLFGKDHVYKLISPQILSEYDLVITIGKTAYYALAVGVPIFMYDINVSEGYVTTDNFSVSLSSNFAKKDTYRCCSCDELWSRVIEGYPIAVKNASKLKKMASEKFSSEVLLRGFLQKIDSLPCMDYERLYHEWPTLRFVGGSFCEEFARREREYASIDAYLQAEISQHFDLMQKHAELQNKYDELALRLERIESSRSWKVIQEFRRLKAR